MSRIGKLPVAIPEKVEVKITWNSVEVQGEKGTLSFEFSNTVAVNIEEGKVIVSKLDDAWKALWGTTRAVIANMIEWVSNGYKKSLEINGVGYKFEAQGQKLILSIGFSHKVEMDVPSDITIVMDEKAKNVLHISWIDKQKVGQFASKIKAKKKPEPYKWKGIKYLGEHVRRKAGKTGAK
jgi:large subunit ribosomal protein L6